MPKTPNGKKGRLHRSGLVSGHVPDTKYVSYVNNVLADHENSKKKGKRKKIIKGLGATALIVTAYLANRNMTQRGSTALNISRNNRTTNQRSSSNPWNVIGGLQSKHNRAVMQRPLNINVSNTGQGGAYAAYMEMKQNDFKWPPPTNNIERYIIQEISKKNNNNKLNYSNVKLASIYKTLKKYPKIFGINVNTQKILNKIWKKNGNNGLLKIDPATISTKVVNQNQIRRLFRGNVNNSTLNQLLDKKKKTIKRTTARNLAQSVGQEKIEKGLNNAAVAYNSLALKLVEEWTKGKEGKEPMIMLTIPTNKFLKEVRKGYRKPTNTLALTNTGTISNNKAQLVILNAAYTLRQKVNLPQILISIVKGSKLTNNNKNTFIQSYEKHNTALYDIFEGSVLSKHEGASRDIVQDAFRKIINTTPTQRELASRLNNLKGISNNNINKTAAEYVILKNKISNAIAAIPKRSGVAYGLSPLINAITFASALPEKLKGYGANIVVKQLIDHLSSRTEALSKGLGNKAKENWFVVLTAILTIIGTSRTKSAKLVLRPISALMKAYIKAPIAGLSIGVAATLLFVSWILGMNETIIQLTSVITKS